MSSTKEREVQKGKIPIKHCNAQKWATAKKFSNNWITVTCVLQRIHDLQISQKEMVVKEKGTYWA
jgi:hypothetical protein